MKEPAVGKTLEEAKGYLRNGVPQQTEILGCAGGQLKEPGRCRSRGNERQQVIETFVQYGTAWEGRWMVAGVGRLGDTVD